MRTTATVLILALVLSGCASSASEKPSKSVSTMGCSMMGDMSAMQKEVGSMMSDMDGMMRSTSDPALKAKMQAMHEQMVAMMGNMKKMSGGMGMMGGGMMRGSSAGKAPAATSSPTPSGSPEDHETHHPK